MSTNYKLIYFQARERGEFIRYIFEQAGVAYDQYVVQFQEWQTMKPKMPMGSVPVLEFEGKQLCQSTSIGRYLAHKFGLAGKNEWDIAFCDMLSQCVEDLNSALNPYVVAATANDEKKKIEEWAKFRDTALKFRLDKFEQYLGDKKFFCGDYLTYIDLVVAEWINRVDMCFDKDFTNNYPKLKQHCCRIHELPNIKKYIQKRPMYMF